MFVIKTSRIVSKKNLGEEFFFNLLKPTLSFSAFPFHLYVNLYWFVAKATIRSLHKLTAMLCVFLFTPTSNEKRREISTKKKIIKSILLRLCDIHIYFFGLTLHRESCSHCWIHKILEKHSARAAESRKKNHWMKMKFIKSRLMVVVVVIVGGNEDKWKEIKKMFQRENNREK